MLADLRQPQDRLKRSLPRLQRLAGRAPKSYFREFWALKDVLFEVKKGERSGSGKSTCIVLHGYLSTTAIKLCTLQGAAVLAEALILAGSPDGPHFSLSTKSEIAFEVVARVEAVRQRNLQIVLRHLGES